MLCRDCRDGWGTLIMSTGCTGCNEGLRFFKGELKAACSQLQDKNTCESNRGTQLAGQAVCNDARGSAVESAAGALLTVHTKASNDPRGCTGAW